MCTKTVAHFLKLKQLQPITFTAARSRSLCTSANTENPTITEKGGFAQAFDKFTTLEESPKLPDNQTFASLLRHSKLMDLGDPDGKIVSGKIFHIVEDDLYIDFGWKFHCVCPRPNKNGSDFVRGSKVRLKIKDLELSTMFLGSSKDLTILEADCQIIGLIASPARNSDQSA